jgi:effector-binding domain-containing protein
MLGGKALIWTNVLLFLIITGGCAGVSEEAKYSVVLKEGDLELRRYEPQIVAETIVEGDFDEVGNEAFRRLFGYISGKNRKNQPIPMTAPVSQEKEGEKIPMTAPVNQERRGDQWSITFLMPSQYTMQTLPEPVDDRVHLREVPERLTAAITYSGTWSRKRYELHKEKLLEWMRDKQLEQTGEPVYARYNPPFTLWFMRRNEVLIPVRDNESR